LGNIETFEMDKYYKFFLIKTNGWKDPLKFVFLCEFK
jgi:hypothetical protein